MKSLGFIRRWRWWWFSSSFLQTKGNDFVITTSRNWWEWRRRRRWALKISRLYSLVSLVCLPPFSTSVWPTLQISSHSKHGNCLLRESWMKSTRFSRDSFCSLCSQKDLKAEEEFDCLSPERILFPISIRDASHQIAWKMKRQLK